MVYELGHVGDQFNTTNVAIGDLQEHRGFAGNSHKKRRCGINNVNKFIGNIAKNYMETTNGENWPSDLINHLNSQYPTSIDTQKGLQDFIKQELQDTNLHQIVSSNSSLPDLYVPPVFRSSNLGYSSESYMNVGYNRYNNSSVNLYSRGLSGGFPVNEYSQNVGCGGMKLISPLGVNQTDLDLITSPEQVSSITACSYGDMISDSEAFDSRAKNSFQQQPFCNSQYGKKRTAYNMDYPLISMDDVQSPYSNSFNVQQNLLSVNGEKTSNGGEYKIPRIEAQLQFATKSPTQLFGFRVLQSYIVYKDMPEGLRKEVHFQDYMHAAECNENVCNCQLYVELASHFDQCNDLNCKICVPARLLASSNGDVQLESRKRKKDLSEAIYNVIDTSINGTLFDALPTKYPKVEISTAGDGVSQEHAANGEHESMVIKQINDITNFETEKSRESRPDNLSSKERATDEKDKSNQIDANNACDSTMLNVSSIDNHSELEPEKIKIQSVSLADFFTADQIKDHLLSFASQKDISGKSADSFGPNLCQLCTKDKLVFAPTPIYCSSCDTRIKRNVGYYRSANEIGIRHCFCMSCYRGSHGTNILMRGLSIPKSNLQKAKNDEEKEDSWVLCDKCQCWQHRICGLYNDEKDVEGKAEYICPKCYLEEIESGIRVPLLQNTSSGAKDLPKTNLSDHIEERLNRRLNQERDEMAKVSGIKPEEVPGAEGLVVRVVVSVEKQLEVRQKFKDILHGESYPTGFTYRSKLIFLFQKIEGVDVCLFGMCVQEFGSECGGPNQRCVYISYLDSVKYFRPERKSVTGESLRTFVYHEILIGYLEYCKMRGFATCYIWACPLIKGEDYIFYCHPESQRTPKQDKLRQWYKSMLKKGAEDNVVVGHTNLYNQFFVSSGQGNAKITLARLPYFDGDYWSGAAENIVRKLEVEEKGGGLQSKLPNKRILKAMGQDKVDVAMKDVLVMQKLGQTILPVKENFMIVHLQHICTHCHEVVLSGSRWFCSHCKKIQLCSRCFNADKNFVESKVHTCHSGEKNQLSEVVVNNVTLDTKDKDDVFVNSFFETRDAFLNKCQKSHFQFDTLARAKYSSMMILYHLIHKPVFKPTCNACHKDVQIEQCWDCDTCPKYYLCDSCYKMNRAADHPHRLYPPSTEFIWGSKSGQFQKQTAITMQLKGVMDALMHASECAKIPCSYPGCTIMRRLFYHAARCSVRAPGGCDYCQRVWAILKEHSQRCQDSNCRIPRCMDIKIYKMTHAARPANGETTMKDQQEDVRWQ